MKLAEIEKTVILLTALALAAVLFIGLGILPLTGKVQGISRQYRDNQKELAVFEQKKLLARALRGDGQGQQEEIAKAESIFLPENDAIGFITTLEEIAWQTGNRFEIEAAASSPFDQAEKTLDLHLSLWGDFKALLLFMANLENSPYPPYRLIEIENLAVRKLEQGNMLNLDEEIKPGNLEASFNIKVYLQ